jgi:hypothetical protein
MINRLLARLSDTPQYESGMRAYDVPFRTEHGEDSTVILTQGNEKIGEQIRQTLFANHPNATDYTFREFDYLAFQYRTFVETAIANTLGHMAFGDSFDETEF